MPESMPIVADLDARVAALDSQERMFVVLWLARCGPEHPDGQALTRALDVVSDRKERLGSVTA